MSSSKNRMRRRGHFKEEEKVTIFFKTRFFLFALCIILLLMGIIMTVFDYTSLAHASYKGVGTNFILQGWHVILIGIGSSIFVWWFVYRMKS